MIDSKLQKQRFEFKYLTNETKSFGIRHFVESYLDLDSFGATQPHRSYPVHSIYLDSHGLRTYIDTINGNRNRYKLRVRYYENGGNSPAYLEIKRRFDKVIAKKRAVVHRDAVEPLIAGAAPSMDHLVSPSPDQFEALRYFCEIRYKLDAKPKTHVSYLREAYEKEGSNSVRVTFDREVFSEVTSEISFRTNLQNPVSVFGSQVILELKFSDRYPEWFQSVVESFNLTQGSAAKYVDGLVKLNQRRLISLDVR